MLVERKAGMLIEKESVYAGLDVCGGLKNYRGVRYEQPVVVNLNQGLFFQQGSSFFYTAP